jgi:hypothetical protein
LTEDNYFNMALHGMCVAVVAAAAASLFKLEAALNSEEMLCNHSSSLMLSNCNAIQLSF